jgi:hypothetical protein
MMVEVKKIDDPLGTTLPILGVAAISCLARSVSDTALHADMSTHRPLIKISDQVLISWCLDDCMKVIAGRAGLRNLLPCGSFPLIDTAY